MRDPMLCIGFWHCLVCGFCVCVCAVVFVSVVSAFVCVLLCLCCAVRGFCACVCAETTDNAVPKTNAKYRVAHGLGAQWLRSTLEQHRKTHVFYKTDRPERRKTRVFYKTDRPEHGKTPVFYKTDRPEHGKTRVFYKTDRPEHGQTHVF